MAALTQLSRCKRCFNSAITSPAKRMMTVLLLHPIGRRDWAKLVLHYVVSETPVSEANDLPTLAR